MTIHTTFEVSLDHLTDDELMQKINDGVVEESLAALQKRHGPRVRSLIREIVGDAHLADDVSQEVFAKLFFKSHLYRLGSNFQAWLCEVARNQARTALRRRHRVPRPVSSLGGARASTDEDPLEGVPDPHVDRSLEELEFGLAFERAVDELPPAQREVFELCVVRGVQYQEAARQLGIPTGTVAIRIMRARKKLFGKLSAHVGRLRRPPACVQ